MKKHTIAFLFFLALFGCTKPYNPKAISSPNKYLVVEGVINSGTDSTKIKLSYTVNLNSKITVNPVLGAVVAVEGSQGSSFPLTDLNNNGLYCSAPLGLSPLQQYRLRVTGSDGNVYLSDFMAVKPTPPIDSVTYPIKNGNMYINVNSHDPTNSTRYYRYEYGETWMFAARYLSQYVVDTNSNTMVQRSPAQRVYDCFGSDSSSNILLANTTRLAQDVVYQNQLTYFSIHSEKIETEYSILVKQYALTSDAYTFYQNLQRTTETLGSIFDSQPTQINGNIHNVTNPNQPVIGYLTVTNPQSKRIFISNSVFGQYIPVDYPYVCGQETVLYNNPIDPYNTVETDLIERPTENVATSPILALGGGIIGFYYTSVPCGDCTIRGTTSTPPFWK
jgi:hypothetical protein